MAYVKIDSKQSELAAIEEYMKLKNFLRNRNRDDKLSDFNINLEASKLFRPIIESTDRVKNELKQQQQQ